MSRRFQAFTVGLPRTGSMVIYDIFKLWNVGFEPMSTELVDAIMGGSHKHINNVLAKKEEIGLEMEVSYLNGFVIKNLVELFPHAKFILCARDIYGWICNITDYVKKTRRSDSPHHVLLMDWLLQGEFSENEAGIKGHLGYPLKNYINLWHDYNKAVLDAVPSDRLLIIKMHDAATSRGKIAHFLGVPENSMSLGYEETSRCEMLTSLNRPYLTDLVKPMRDMRNRLGF